MASKKEELEKKKADVPSTLDFSGDAGEGMEEMGMDDVVAPILVILQSGSPECKPDMPEYKPEAREGMLYNKSTNELFNKSVDVIPCLYEKKYFEWKPQRRGLAGIHPVTTALVETGQPNESGRIDLPNGNFLDLTSQYYCLLVAGDEQPFSNPQAVIISFYGTALKKSRQWNSTIRNLKLDGPNGSYTPPMFSHIYRLSTVRTSNDKGSWMTWEIETVGVVNDSETYDLAKKVYKAATQNRVRVDTDTAPGDDVPF